MIRLLISLYLVVFVSIILINQGSEFIWQHYLYQAPDELRHAKQVAQLLQSSVVEPEQLDSRIVRHQLDEIAWLPEQRALLLQGQVITTYTEHNQAVLSFLMQDKQSLVQLGPFAPPKQAMLSKYLIKLFSFVALGLLLMLWLRPLWQDLMQLKYVTGQLAKGELDISIAPSRFSAIATLTSQFHSMAVKVANLMSNQKHLVNAVSHELRTPLARLKFALAMLANEAPKPVEQMSQDVQEMELLIDEMLSYARLEMAQTQLKFERVNLCEIVQQQIHKLQRITQKQVELLAPSQPCYIRAERHHLERAVQNLLQNADKYGTSLIEVKIHLASEAVYLNVSDDGKGIAKADQDKVFEPFMRLEQSRNKSSGGFGLGLAIVDKIVTWHGGECIVEDADIGGAQFVVRLPKL